MKISFERRGIALVAGASMAVIWTNTVAVICAAILKLPTTVPVVAISTATIMLGMLMTLMLLLFSQGSKFHRWLPILSLALGSVACLGLNQYYQIPAILAPAFLFASVFYGIGLPWIARRLPASLDGSFRSHRRIAVIWLLLGLFTIAQSARISIFMADPSQLWAAVIPDKGIAYRMDLSVYTYAGDLSRQGVANLYDVSYYPNDYPDEITPRTSVLGIAPFLFTHFEYPPPFLLLPRLAIALTNNFLTIRAVWFAIDATLIGLVMVLLALWVGERSGRIAALLIPALWVSIPVMFNLELGQFHLTCIALSIAAMIAFDRKRYVLGGALLAIAVAAKISPGLLVLYLLLQKRWREAAWTLGFCALYSVLGLIVLGPAPYIAFLSYQIPHISSGEQFAFFDWSTVVRINNQSIYGLVDKLFLLGLPGDWQALTSRVGWLYSLFLLGFTVVAARSSTNRLQQAQIWLALLSLAALRSPVAPGIYILSSTLWLCIFLVDDFGGQMWQLVLCVVFMLIAALVLPLPIPVQVTLSLIGQLYLLTLNIRTIMRASAQTHASLAGAFSAQRLGVGD